MREPALQHVLSSQRFEDVFYAPPPAWLPALSLGYDEALADLMWIKGLIYFGEALGERTAVKHVYSYVDTILELDPHFARVYRWASTAGIYKPEVTVDDLRRAAAYAERGAAQFPDDGQMAWEAGSTIMYELVPRLKSDAEREAERRKAVTYLETAAREHAGPSWLALVNLKYLKQLGQNARAIRHLEEIYLSTDDEDLKRDLQLKIAALRGAEYAEALRLETEALERERLQRFPYLNPFLFELVTR